MKEIHLSGKKGKGKVTIVDDENYEELSKFKWNISNFGYVVRTERDKTINMHRVIMNTPDGMDTDHINHDKLDNRKENLRICTRSQNMANSSAGRKGNKYKGITWHIIKLKWEAKFEKEGKVIFVGYFNDIRDAIIEYNKRIEEELGEFACPIPEL